MQKTLIEWVKNPDGTQGYTWNPITGCLNGCEYCYARKLANGRLRSRYLANQNVSPLTDLSWERKMTDPFYPRFWEDRLLAPCHTAYKGIFTCDMSDLFGIGIPEDWTYRVMNTIKACYSNRFYLLTKQPQNLIKWEFPENCWVGVTTTTTKMFADSIIKSQGIRATIRYVSLEPLLEWSWNNTYEEPLETVLKAEGINWVIIGAMTCGGDKLSEMSYKHPELTPMPYGNRYTLQPKIEWVEEIARACDKAKLPIFMKDNLRPIWYNHLRQEMPVEDDYANHRRDPTRL